MPDAAASKAKDSSEDDDDDFGAVPAKKKLRIRNKVWSNCFNFDLIYIASIAVADFACLAIPFWLSFCILSW